MFATGIDYAGRLLSDDSSRPSRIGTAALAVAGAREFLKLDGVRDRIQLSDGERYQEIVSPPLQRLTAATAAVQLDHGEPLTSAAAELVRAANALADEARSGNRAFERVESAFEGALRDFQAVAPDRRQHRK